jgi:hypothetical protein
MARLTREAILRASSDIDARTRLLQHAERLGWPALRAGRLHVRPGGTHWRQMTTLAKPRELLVLAAALALARDGGAMPR